ncbi:Uncharacterized protein J5U22_01076 [Saccharolobus shibatae]|uniref:Uncharacterized protein n=2 Tax=Saccharolobus shibatae TaxID=2286 RepID=A0A8F5GVY6_9CREN|nr:Uncharacterized protein J5U21_01164 [Saccharolobus shibatae]QXJ34530.1 Uncharacterized protein J5U22_01076 [Saccharolobus shibatae]
MQPSYTFKFRFIRLSEYYIIMQNFRELSIDIVLSHRIRDYDQIILEGSRKRDSCVFFTYGYCKKVSSKSKVLASWISNGKIVPHPLFCYLCPFYSLRDDDKTVTIDLFDIYLTYKNLKTQIERELEFIESRLSEFSFSTSIALKRRREDLIAFLDDISTKIKILMEIIRVSEREHEDGRHI